MTTSHLDGIFVDNCFLEKGRAFSIWSDLGSPHKVYLGSAIRGLE